MLFTPKLPAKATERKTQLEISLMQPKRSTKNTDPKQY